MSRLVASNVASISTLADGFWYLTRIGATGYVRLRQTRCVSQEAALTILFDVQSVPLADDPSAWPGLPGGTTGNTSSAETSENEGEASASKLGRAGLTMADQIVRARSGVSSGQKEEGRKRLTNLNGWSSKPGAEAGPEGIETKPKGQDLALCCPSTLYCTFKVCADPDDPAINRHNLCGPSFGLDYIEPLMMVETSQICQSDLKLVHNTVLAFHISTPIHLSCT